VTDLRASGVAGRRVAPRDSLGFELQASQFWLEPRVTWAAPPATPPRPVVARRAPAAPDPTAARTPTARPTRRREGSRAGGARTAATRPKGAQGGTEAAPLGTRIGVISDNHGYLDGAILEIGTISKTTVAAAVGKAVKKSGRTTGLTRSTISGLNATVTVGYTDECNGKAFNVTYTGQIIVTNRRSGFLNSGDSGSLMVEDVTTNPRVVGLLFAGSSTTAVANPIGPVLTYLGVTMVGI